MNFEVAFEEWKIYASKRHKKQSFDTLPKKTFKFILPYFKGKDIFSITKVDYIYWQNTILEFNFKNSYNQLLHSCFCQFLSFCQLYYDLDLNVAKIVGGFPKHNEEKNTDYYTLSEFKKFIKCVDNVVYKQFFTLLFFSGLRPSEAMALRFIDLENGFLYVRHNIQRKGKRLLDTPKNSSSIRKIMLDRKLFRDLKDDFVVIDKTIDSHGNRSVGTPKTFSSYRNIYLDKFLIRDLLKLKRYYAFYNAIFGGMFSLFRSKK